MVDSDRAQQGRSLEDEGRGSAMVAPSILERARETGAIPKVAKRHVRRAREGVRASVPRVGR
jgi:hypothetical protein